MNKKYLIFNVGHQNNKTQTKRSTKSSIRWMSSKFLLPQKTIHSYSCSPIDKKIKEKKIFIVIIKKNTNKKK